MDKYKFYFQGYFLYQAFQYVNKFSILDKIKISFSGNGYHFSDLAMEIKLKTEDGYESVLISPLNPNKIDLDYYTRKNKNGL